MVSTHSDTSSTSSKKPKEKLMKNFITAIEHLLPIEHDKVHHHHHHQSLNNNLNSIHKSNSFLDNLNSILQTSHPQNRSSIDGATQTETPKKLTETEKNYQNYSSRKSIFSDTEFELNHDTKTAYTNNDSSSSTKENSIKSIGFQHIQKPSLDYDSDEEIGEIQEERDPDLHITDDYIINTQKENTEDASSKSLAPNFKRSTPQRAVSDVPRIALTIYEAGTKSLGSFIEQKPKISTVRLKPFSSCSQDSENEKGLTRQKKNGTISLVPVGMTKMKNRSRTESVSKQDILNGVRSRNDSSNCLIALNRTKTDTQTLDSGKSSNNDKESVSTDSLESKTSFKEESFSCALQKDILIQGKLYLNYDNLHFRSKIFGIKTEIEVDIKDIVQLEKKTTAILFPNGIIVKTLDKTYTFASFLNRDSVFEKIMKRWSDSIMSGIGENPSQKPSRVPLQNKNSSNRSRNISFKLPQIFDNEGDGLKLKTPVKKMIHGFIDSSSEGGDYENSSDRIDTDQSEDGSVDKSDDDMTSDDEYEESEEAKPNDSSNANTSDFGPNKGTKYEPDLKSYKNDTDIADYTLQNTTLGKVFKIMSDKMYELLEKGGNNTISEVPQIYSEDDNGEGLKDGHYKRNYSYVKPLNSSLGPKETKCLVKDVLEKVDLSKYFIINQTTETPDVPSGKSFHVITNMIFFWAGEDSVKMRAFTKVVWTGKSWIKGPVESGNTTGQKASMKSLIEAIQKINDSNGQNVNTNASNGKSRKKSKSKTPKRTNSKSQEKTNDEEQQDKMETESQNKFASLTQSIPSFSVISQYLTWLIIFYLVIDRYKTHSLVSKQLQRQEYKIKADSQISENEIWDWVFKRSSKDNFNYERHVYSKSENQSELTKFDEQELYILRQLKQKELDVLNDMLI
ncbi:unnamed protein product [Hanseniaspora opuntiae]